jgi:hypothetical protein
MLIIYVYLLRQDLLQHKAVHGEEEGIEETSEDRTYMYGTGE